MKKIFEKNELFFCILLIIVYVVSNSYGVQNFVSKLCVFWNGIASS